MTAIYDEAGIRLPDAEAAHAAEAEAWGRVYGEQHAVSVLAAARATAESEERAGQAARVAIGWVAAAAAGGGYAPAAIDPAALAAALATGDQGDLLCLLRAAEMAAQARHHGEYAQPPAYSTGPAPQRFRVVCDVGPGGQLAVDRIEYGGGRSIAQLRRGRSWAMWGVEPYDQGDWRRRAGKAAESAVMALVAVEREVAP